MKSIIHDWADDEALKILENVRRAATPTSKLVLYETVVTPPNVKHFAKLLDIEMIGARGWPRADPRRICRAVPQGGVPPIAPDPVGWARPA